MITDLFAKALETFLYVNVRSVELLDEIMTFRISLLETY